MAVNSTDLITTQKTVEIFNNSAVSGISNGKKQRYQDNGHRPVSFLTEDEVNTLFDAAGKMYRGDRNELIMRILFMSACRVSECLALTFSCRTKVKDTFTLFIAHGKGDKPRLVAIPEDLYYRIGNYCQEHGLGNDDKLFYIGRFRVLQIVKECARAAGLNNRRVYCHLFRHSGALARLRRTGNLQSLKMQLGHSSSSMTQRYLVTMQMQEALEIEGKVQFER